MLDCKTFYDLLTEQGISFWTGVPDSLLKDFCAYVTAQTDPSRHIITANEGGAIALAAGHYLGGGGLSVAYMQNSGLGNTVNPLTSLADKAVYGIPMLLVIGWRGEPGKKDEPQHVTMGEVTLPLLDACNVPHHILPNDIDAARGVVRAAIAQTTASMAPVALVVKKGTFASYALPNEEPAYPMTREEAVGAFVASLSDADVDPLIVSTTGKPSRELFEMRVQRGEAHDTDFLTVGCMGHASQIALGVAGARKDRPVYCIDGDGAVIMHMGGLTSIGTSGLENYKHVVLNNGAHDSVGGQPTVAFDVDLCGVARACGYRFVWKAENAEQLADLLPRFHQVKGPALLEIRVAKGARSDLGRPTMKPPELKTRFMAAGEAS